MNFLFGLDCLMKDVTVFLVVEPFQQVLITFIVTDMKWLSSLKIA
jgi:hypothetical protein